MADDAPPRPDAAAGPAQQPPAPAPAPPPPLTNVRVRGQGGRGLNKPAILAAAGAGVVVVLLVASNALTSRPSRGAIDAKPIMSDPARPEMAQSAVRDLPAGYPEAAAREAARQPANPPSLGPPLPGDVAAFAPDLHFEEARDDSGAISHSAGIASDPAAEEAREADRSAIFFALRQQPIMPSAGGAGDQRRPEAGTGLSRAASRNQLPPAASVDAVLFPGTVIPASLITAINSESAGPVIAQVTQTVYDSLTSRVAVIPQGARLIGDYKSATQYGQGRIAILWSRLIMPDGEEIALDEAGADPSGAAGVPGTVDNHWTAVFGAAALGTLISIGVATTEDPQLAYDGIGASTRDPVDDALAEGVQRGASIATNRVVERSLAIPPTIRIEAGRRIAVMVTRSLATGSAT